MEEDLPVGFHERVLAAIGQAVVAVDRTHRVRYWNRAAEDLYGYPAGEAVGCPVYDLIIPADGREQAVARGGRLLTPGELFVGDWRVRNRAGQIFTAFVTANPITGRDGVVLGSLAVSLDVSAQRAAQARVRELAAIVEASDDGIIHADEHGVIRHANPAVRKLYGYEPAELIGRDITLLIPFDEIASVSTAMAEVLAGRSPGLLLTNSRRRDGTLIDVSLRLSPVRGQDGAIVGISGIGRDVTAVVRTQALLADSERRFRTRFDQSQVPQAMVALDGRLLSVNQALCILLERSAEDLRGTNVRLLLHPSDDGDAAAAVALLAGGGAGSWERVLSRPDGTAVPVQAHATMLREDDETPYAVAVFLQDLTRLREAERRLSRREALFRALVARASDWAFLLDPNGVVRHASAKVVEAFGEPSSAGTSTVRWPSAHPDDAARVRQVLQSVSTAPHRSEMVTFRVPDATGRWRWVEDLLTNHIDDPHIGGVVCNRRDVTERVEAERALRASEARHRSIAETAQEGIWAVDLAGNTVFANRKLAAILGVPLTAVYEGSATELLATDDSEFFRNTLQHSLERGMQEYELTYAHPDGRTRTLKVSAAPMHDGVGEPSVLAMLSDVTDIREAERELRRRSLHDDLTGLPNRALLADRLERALLHRAAGHGQASVAVLFIDLDQFKLVNDSFGHTAGDRFLAAVAERLTSVVRPVDTLARFGGDKFVVVADDTDQAQALDLAARVHTGLVGAVEIDRQRIYTGASVGIACAPPHRPGELLRFAEAAMYEAKARGRARTQVFEPELAQDAIERLVLGGELREALAQDDLTLHYQPVVDLSTGQLLAVEALARWLHPRRGPVPPERFVRVAEDCGFVSELDRWTLRRAAADAPRLRRAVPASLRVAVNISARHMTDCGLEETVHQLVRTGPLAAEQLTLEVTENSVMNDPERARNLLHRLKAMGIQTYLDDFGTGHSSLGQLRKLPVAVLKLDNSFVAEITTDPDSLAIAGSIIALAEALHLSTIAEGVETAEQLTVLRDLGCTAAQGFLWTPALPPDELADLIGSLPNGRFTVPAASHRSRPPAGPHGRRTAGQLTTEANIRGNP